MPASQLMQLEEELGVKLFHRGKYNVTLTEDGMLLKRRAKELVELSDKTIQELSHNFGEHIAYINVLRNMSVSCDCEGIAAMPVVTPNIGIVASPDILAADQASVDMVYALKEEEHHELVGRQCDYRR